MALFQAAAILIAMTAAAGCFVGPAPYWGPHHAEWHDH
jgi:hypothetical protein